MLGTLVAGRISIAAASLASARTALTIAVRYSEARRQFGPAGAAEVPILDYLSQQRALLPRLATTYGLTFALRHLIRRHGDAEGGDAREVEVMAAGLKAYASRHNLDTLQACREACGGQGYLAANRFAALRADTDVFTTFEGANVVLLLLVSKGLLSRFNEEMGDLKLWGMVKYLADRAGTRVAELNPIVTRRTDEDHLLDPELHTSAFEYREEWLLASAGRRLKTLIDAGVDSFDAMNACQDHLVSLAMAHTERVVLLHFQDAVMRAPSPLLSEVLRTLASLYALSRIDAHKGWYLESGYMEPAKTRAIRTMVNRLCGEVREQAVPLVDAFGIPDAVLRAPAAFASP
jgi:acyl-CoA oxidase